MIQIFALLIGEERGTAAAYPIFRSITAERLRLTIMKTLLEESPINVTKGEKFDEILGEFATLNKSRNDYVHGLWWTHESGKVFLAAPSPDDPHPFMSLRPQSLKVAEDIHKRIGKLTVGIIRFVMAFEAERMQLAAFLEGLAPQPSADGSATPPGPPAK